MIPNFPEFKTLELSDRVEIESITKQFPPYSDYHFPLMYIWDIHEPILLSVLNNNLIIRHSDALTGESFYSFIGTNAIEETINKISIFLKENNFPTTLKLIPEEIIKNLNGFASSAVEDRDNHDYIFDIEKIFHSKGNGFRHYRNHINKFEKKYSNITTNPIDLTDSIVKTQITNLFNTWSENRISDNKAGNLIFENKALNKLLSSANEFKSLSSLGLYDKNKLIAFSIFDFINKDFALCSFLLANKTFEGSFQYLMKETINLLHKQDVKFLNFEADCGVSSWREYKMLYRPPFFLKKYTIESCN